MGKFLEIFAYVLIVAIAIRVVLSWTGFDIRNPLHKAIHDVTEPILAPIRSVVPAIGGLDWSTFVAIFLLFFLAQLGSKLASGG